MLLGALWTPILEPKWSQLGSNWGWERLQLGSKSESVPPIVCTAIGGTPAAASNRQQQTNKDPSWNPDGSNGDLLPFCFHMLNSASRLLAVKGLSWRLFQAFLNAFEGLLVQWSFQRLSGVHFESHLGAKMEPKFAFF